MHLRSNMQFVIMLNPRSGSSTSSPSPCTRHPNSSATRCAACATDIAATHRGYVLGQILRHLRRLAAAPLPDHHQHVLHWNPKLVPALVCSLSGMACNMFRKALMRSRRASFHGDSDTALGCPQVFGGASISLLSFGSRQSHCSSLSADDSCAVQCSEPSEPTPSEPFPSSLSSSQLSSMSSSRSASAGATRENHTWPRSASDVGAIRDNDVDYQCFRAPLRTPRCGSRCCRGWHSAARVVRNCRRRLWTWCRGWQMYIEGCFRTHG